MKINSIQNNLQTFEGKLVLQNYNRGGKKTVRETLPEFDKNLVDCLKEIIKKYPLYIIPINEIKGLEEILRKINITLPPARMAENDKAHFFCKADDNNSCVFEVFGAFRINLKA